MKKRQWLLALLILSSCGGLGAQTFEVKDDNLRVASLDGLWRFHPGDDPTWADPKFDDSKWALLRSDKDWSSQGYKDMSGLAWYRFQLIAPARLEHVSLSLPSISTCYEVYADGVLIGTYGKMPPNTAPYASEELHRAYGLPEGKRAGRRVAIALRVWHWPGWAMYYGGGPFVGGGLFGDSGEIEHRIKLERASQYWSRAEDLIDLILSGLISFGMMTLYLLRRKDPEYLWFSLSALIGAAAGWVQVSTMFEVRNIEIRDMVNGIADAAGSLASIAFYCYLLRPKRGWLLKLAFAAAVLDLINSTADSLSGYIFGVWFWNLIGWSCSLIFDVWVLSAVFAAAKKKSPDARLLVLPVTLNTGADLWSSLAQITYTAGWQHVSSGSYVLTQKPFPIEIGNVTGTIFLLAVMGILALRFARTRSQEERFASEVEGARSVQQYLIPAQLPRTPGFTLESEYMPAREVGGDFFQILPIASDGGLLVVVGDVAGKGLEAGMLATLIVGAVRTAVAFTGDASAILSLLNERLQGRGLVTCLALRVDGEGNAMLVNAGHLPPYLNGAEMEMEGALPLGAIPGVEFPVLRFHLGEGDSLVLMSDGIVEAQKADGELFGFERVGKMLRESATAGELAAAARDFGQEDDITVLSVARAAVLVTA